MADPFASISRRALEKLITRREARLLLDKNVGITDILAYLQSLLQQVSLRQEQPFTRARSISLNLRPWFSASRDFGSSHSSIFLALWSMPRFLLPPLENLMSGLCTTSDSMSIILGATGDPGWVNILLGGVGGQRVKVNNLEDLET